MVGAPIHNNEACNGVISQCGSLPVSVMCQAACSLNGCIYVSGGYAVDEAGENYLTLPLDNFYCYDTETNTVVRRASMPKPCSNHIIFPYDNKIAMFDPKEFEFYFYDVEEDEWSEAEPLTHLQNTAHYLGLIQIDSRSSTLYMLVRQTATGDYELVEYSMNTKHLRKIKYSSGDQARVPNMLLLFPKVDLLSGFDHCFDH